jgi:glycosyltransferase involved in cell wall biosynthesis
MNIIVVNDFAHVNGGAASVAISGAKVLASCGHRVTFFSAVKPVDRSLETAGVEVVCTGQQEILKDPNRFRAVCQGLWNPVASRRLAVCLSGLNRSETIIHLHGWTKALSASVVRAALNRDFKVVCTLHDYFAACPNGGFFDHKILGHCHLKPLSLACVVRPCDARSYSHKLWRVTRQVIQQEIGHVPRGIDAFIVLSRLSRTIHAPYLPPDAPIFDVPNPVEVEKLAPVEVARNRWFTMVGRLSPEKGGVLLARAARECGAPVVFVGEGASRDAIASANPASVITGWLPRAGVAKHLSEARALVLPSLWYECQPLAVLEAAGRGIPAVVSDDCAAAESVQHEVTGLLFKSGDAPSLARALRRLSDDALARRLGAAAYERYWAAPPTLEHHVALLEEVYAAVLRGCGH